MEDGCDMAWRLVRNGTMIDDRNEYEGSHGYETTSRMRAIIDAWISVRWIQLYSCPMIHSSFNKEHTQQFEAPHTRLIFQSWLFLIPET